FLDGPGTDLDVIVDEKLLQAAVDECRQRRPERPRRLRRTAFGFRERLLVARRWPRDGGLEAARQRVAPAVDGLDVSLADLFLEEGVRNGDRRFPARLHQLEQEEVRDEDPQEPKQGPPGRHLRLARARRRSAGRRTVWPATGCWSGDARSRLRLSCRAHDLSGAASGRIAATRARSKR